MPPHEDEPLWPSADTDEAERKVTSAGKAAGGGGEAEAGGASDGADRGRPAEEPAGASGEEPRDGRDAPEVREPDRDGKQAQARNGDEAPTTRGGEQASAPTSNDERAEAARGEDRPEEQPTQPQPRPTSARTPLGQPPEVTSDDQPTAWMKLPAQPPRDDAKAGSPERQQEPAQQEMTQQLPIVLPWIRQPSSDQQAHPGRESGRAASGEAGQKQAGQSEPGQDQPTLFTPVPGSGRPSAGQGAADRLEDQPTLFTPIPQLGRPTPGSRPIPPAGSVHAQPMRIEPSGEVRPADGSTGPVGETPNAGQAPEPATGETPVVPPSGGEPATGGPRRRKRGLIYSGVAVLVVIAVGVALALPYVSNRLGLPWAPNLPKGDTPRPAAVTLALHAPSPSAPTPTTSGVGTALAGPSANGTLGTLTGIVIDPATGDVLWNRDSGQLLTPASTTKILTTSAALLQLDHGLQLPTKVVQGSSPDTAIIVAGGDLTLSALPDGKESVYQGAAHLDDLVSQVKQAGGGAIKKVQIDLSAYTGGGTAPGWAPEDAPSTYATQIVPAMLDGGLSDPANDHSMRSGNPAGDLLQSFAQRLGASVPAATTAKAAQGAKVLGEVKSAPLTELISQLLEHSDNELAEAVARQTAIATGQPPSFAGGAQATLSVLSQNGFDVSGVSLNDGSGLSTLNKVPARLLAQLISVAAAPEGKDPRTAKLRPLLEGLPVAGGSGTLADRYGDANSSAGKGWIRAKTGTLSGVNTLAGAVLDKDGRVLVFALMSNNNGDINATRAALDAVAAKLRGCGCQ